MTGVRGRSFLSHLTLLMAMTMSMPEATLPNTAERQDVDKEKREETFNFEDEIVTDFMRVNTVPDRECVRESVSS